MLIDPAYVLFETDPAGDSRTVRRACLDCLRACMRPDTDLCVD